MHTESSTGTFQAIEGADYYSNLTGIIAKFGSKHSPDLLGNWSSDVGIQDIANLDLEIIQDSYQKRDANCLTRDNASVGNGRGGFGLVSPSD